jgi:hypothetical protein
MLTGLYPVLCRLIRIGPCGLIGSGIFEEYIQFPALSNQSCSLRSIQPKSVLLSSRVTTIKAQITPVLMSKIVQPQ